MKRKLLSVLLVCILMLSIVPFAAAADPLAYASTQTVLLDGTEVELQAYALKDENGYPTNYVKLRDVACLLNGTAAQFEVGWDGVVNVTTGQSYTANGSELSTPFSGDRPYTVPKGFTRVNGIDRALEAIMLSDDNGGGYTYYKLRDLGNALGFLVDWVQGTGIIIDTDAEPVPAYLPDGAYDEEAFAANYFAPAKRSSTFGLFTGDVTEQKISQNAKKLFDSYENTEGIVLRKLMVGDVPVYEAYRDDGAEKPMVLLLHGGGSDKESNIANLLRLANDGLYAVALDAAGSGESDLGPLMAPLAYAHTVKYIDTLLEYYYTVAQADPSDAAIVGGSMGGNIAYCYVTHGKYTLTAIFPCLATPDLTLLGEKSLFDCFDHGKNNVTPVWTEEQTLAFAAAYSPVQYPERFLDTYIHAGNGALDGSAGPEGPQTLEKALTELGGSNFSFYVDPDRGHERLPEYYDDLFTVIREVLLG